MTISARVAAILVASLLSIAPTAIAQENQPPADKTLSPYFFVESGDPSLDLADLQVFSPGFARNMRKVAAIEECPELRTLSSLRARSMKS